jgi:hypothetical protein
LKGNLKGNNMKFLKKTLAGLLLTVSSFANAELTISQFDMTDDYLQVSFSGMLDELPTEGARNELNILWLGEIGNMSWHNLGFSNGTVQDNGSSRAALQTPKAWSGQGEGRNIFIRTGNGDWQAGETVDLTLTFNYTGGFNPENLDPNNLSVFWGHDGVTRLTSGNEVTSLSVQSPEAAASVSAPASVAFLALTMMGFA